MGALNNPLHWNWLDDTNYYIQPLKNKASSTKIELLIESIHREEEVTIEDLIEKKVKELLASRKEVGKTELIEQELDVGSQHVRRKVVDQLIRDNSSIKQKTKQLKRNKKKLLQSDFSRIPLPQPPLGFLPKGSV